MMVIWVEVDLGDCVGRSGGFSPQQSDGLQVRMTSWALLEASVPVTFF